MDLINVNGFANEFYCFELTLGDIFEYVYWFKGCQMAKDKQSSLKYALKIASITIIIQRYYGSPNLDSENLIDI